MGGKIIDGVYVLVPQFLQQWQYPTKAQGINNKDRYIFFTEVKDEDNTDTF